MKSMMKMKGDSSPVLEAFRAAVRPVRGLSGARPKEGATALEQSLRDDALVWSEAARRVLCAAGCPWDRAAQALIAEARARSALARPMPSPALRALGPAADRSEEDALVEASILEIALSASGRTPEWWTEHGRRSASGRICRQLALRRREILERLERARKSKALYGSAEALLVRDGARGRVARGAALLAFRAMCRRERIEVFFEGFPRTDGRRIWLGPIDFGHPLAPILVWGHGIHERNHIRHTDFAQAAKAPPMLRELVNVLEDARVDALGMAEYGGYRDWREALFRVLAEDGRLAIGGAGQSPAERFMGWILGILATKTLGLALPDGVMRRAERWAAEDLGAELCARIEAMLLERMPLADTADAVRLAEDLAAMLEDARFDALVRLAREAEVDANVRAELLRAAGASASSTAADPDPSGCGAEGSLFVGADLAPSPEAVVRPAQGARLQASICAALGAILDAPLPEPGLGAGIRSLMRRVHLAGHAQTSASGARANLAALQARLDALPPGGYARELRRCGLRTAPSGLFDAVWRSSASLGIRLADLLRRPVPEPCFTSTRGWEVDDGALDKFAIGDDRVFLEAGTPPGHELAVLILCDVSGSLGDEACAVLKATAARLQEAMNRTAGIHAQTAVFPDRERPLGLCSAVRGSIPKLLEALAPVPSYGSTPLGPALTTCFHLLIERREANKLVVVLTDGLFQSEDVDAECALLRSAGIALGMLLLQPAPDRDPLHPPGDAFVTVREAASIPSGIRRLLQALRRRGTFG